MRWNHLPKAGGIYDQSPEFIDGIQLIFAAQSRKQAQDAKRREAEANAAQNRARRKSR